MKPDDYGPQYRQHLLDQYKLYVEMADRISHRRYSANSFFLTLHTGILGITGGLAALSLGRNGNHGIGVAVAIFGILLGLVWWRTLESYRKLNSAKFAVIQDIEERLPIAPYTFEWDKLERGKQSKLYIKLTAVEKWVPLLFVSGYIAAAITNLYLLIRS